jgi:uncharacterized protein YbaA (DUF1428 family)
MDMLHTSICLIVPREAATGPEGIMSQMQIAENVKDDFKKLREAVAALKKEHSTSGLVEQKQSDPRDTQFQGFAKALWTELDERNFTSEACNPAMSMYRDEAITLIARRAYDLVKHTIENTEHYNLDVLSPDEHVERIPDMIELPKVQER